MRISLSVLLFIAALLLPCAHTFAADPDAASVVILVNMDDRESVAIGNYYAEARGIPEGNIIALAMPTEETISLRQFVDEVSNPLLNALMDEAWISGVKARDTDRYGRVRLSVAIHKIRYLVTVRGVPLRFSNDPELLDESLPNLPNQFRFNRGSVDSELALLTGPPGSSMTSLIPNPYFEGKRVSPTDAQRVIKVSRLDGPTKPLVIRLIDRTLEAEKIGLMGRAYVDAGGPHAKGDEWMEATRDLLEAAYFDTSFEASKRLMGFEDRLDAPAIYVGWYRGHAYGPWLEARWSVPPGAIGYHLHSFSATTVRSRTKAWLGALIAQGYSATWGTVYEPYLEFTHHPHILLAHLIKGGNFGDAASLSMPALSWQNVAIGDPLYRPFKVSLDEQLRGSMDSAFSAYAPIREMNRIAEERSEAEAVEYGQSQFSKQPSLALAYRLAQAYTAEGKVRGAVNSLKMVRFIRTFSRDEVVLVQKIASLLHRHGESQIALELFEKLLSDRDLPESLKIALLDAGAAIAGEAGNAMLASRWMLEAQELKQPETP
jgi:uncharacterized protein (TIGR03790 family)